MAVEEMQVCETDGCSSEAKLQCPTCLKLGIQGLFFWPEECFKGSWATYKLLHKKAKNEKAKQEVSSWAVEGDINTDPWAGYRYTCKLRPHCPLACIGRNCYPSSLNYYNFPKSCCTSVNEVTCHGILDRWPLQEGDIVNVDITLYCNGYPGDLNETFFCWRCGWRSTETSSDHMWVPDASHWCSEILFQYRVLGSIIQKHAQANGFSVVWSYCGHGIYIVFHTAPKVPHYDKNIVGVMK
jgi:hypothetical protein